MLAPNDYVNVFAFQVNYQGKSRRRDDRVTALLQSIEKQPPFIEEFLLREDKTLEDYHIFLEKYSDQLDEAVRGFIQERYNEANKNTEMESQNTEHQEL